MTGAELGPIVGMGASALNAVGNDARQESRSDRALVREAAKGTAGLERAAELYGHRLALKEAVVNRLLEPIARLFRVSNEYLQNDFASELAAKLEDVPEEDLVTPKPSVAVPAVQGLALSLDEPTLKEMYLNLLAASATGSRASGVHPSFARAIQELDSEEIHLLNAVLPHPTIPCVRLKAELPDGGFITEREYVIPLSGDDGEVMAMPEHSQSWINNWVRLGLVSTTYLESLHSSSPDVDPYLWVRKRPEYADLEVRYAESPDGATLRFDKGVISITALGRSFYNIVTDTTSSSDALQVT